MVDVGFLSASQYLIHDRDTKFCPAFQRTIEAVGVKTVKLPARSPNLNAFAERWILSVKNECLSKLILFGEAALRRCLTSYLAHYVQQGRRVFYRGGAPECGARRCLEGHAPVLASGRTQS